MATRYGPKAQESVENAMRERKQGKLRSGSGQQVTSQKQAVAIGLSEAREKGAKVPAKPTGGSSSTRGKSGGGKSRSKSGASTSRAKKR